MHSSYAIDTNRLVCGSVGFVAYVADFNNEVIEQFADSEERKFGFTYKNV